MSQIEIAKLRADFPALTQRVRGKQLVYLDSAASALKPWPVIEKISHFYTYGTSNVHRGAHYLADIATQDFEATREAVRGFLNASSTDEIIFTKGTTEGINLLATSYGETFLKPGDEIVLTEMEHHANIVPWQMLAEKKGLTIRWISVTEAGELDLASAEKVIGAKTKIVSFTHCSNTLGTINPAEKVIALAKAVGAITVIDGAQMVANHAVDVQNLQCDFYVFSGHKLFGPYGVGILYGRKALLEQMQPYQGGGSMISEVRFEKTTFNDVPFRFEAGTPEIAGVIALRPAIEYVQKIGFENIQRHENVLVTEALAKLRDIPGLQIFGEAKNRAPIVSFNIAGLHHSDIGQVIDQEGVAVRAGHHCTQPLLRKFGLTGTVRASFSIFNHSKDIDTLCAALVKAKELLQ